MIGNTLEGLPAAPQTYSARSQPTGWASLDSALAELAQQPWVEILGADPGCLMPGDLDEEMLQLESAPELDDKQFMLSSIGLQQYHQAKLTIRLRVLDFGTFQDWIARLHVPMILAGQVRWTVQMHPYPRPVLLFSLVFQYSLDRHLDFISAAILHSLRDCPL